MLKSQSHTNIKSYIRDGNPRIERQLEEIMKRKEDITERLNDYRRKRIENSPKSSAVRNRVVCLSGYKHLASTNSLISQSERKLPKQTLDFTSEIQSVRSVLDNRAGNFGRFNSGSKLDNMLFKQMTERETKGDTLECSTYRSRAKSAQRMTSSRDFSERSISQKLKEAYLLKFPKSSEGERIRQIFKESDQRQYEYQEIKKRFKTEAISEIIRKSHPSQDEEHDQS